MISFDDYGNASESVNLQPIYNSINQLIEDEIKLALNIQSLSNSFTQMTNAFNTSSFVLTSDYVSAMGLVGSEIDSLNSIVSTLPSSYFDSSVLSDYVLTSNLKTDYYSDYSIASLSSRYLYNLSGSINSLLISVSSLSLASSNALNLNGDMEEWNNNTITGHCFGFVNINSAKTISSNTINNNYYNNFMCLDFKSNYLPDVRNINVICTSFELNSISAFSHNINAYSVFSSNKISNGKCNIYADYLRHNTFYSIYDLGITDNRSFIDNKIFNDKTNMGNCTIRNVQTGNLFNYCRSLSINLCNNDNTFDHNHDIYIYSRYSEFFLTNIHGNKFSWNYRLNMSISSGDLITNSNSWRSFSISEFTMLNILYPWITTSLIYDSNSNYTWPYIEEWRLQYNGLPISHYKGH